MASKMRNTGIGKFLENFLDENTDDLSSNLFNMLEDVAADVDREAVILEDEKSELEGQVADLEKRIEELERELEEQE